MNHVTFRNQCAQGDVFFRRVESIPSDATATEDKVVAHSETGHHHMFGEADKVERFTAKDPFVCYLRVEQPAMLEHHREFDTHAPILFAPGCYEVRRQREPAPEGWRMVAD